MFHGSMVALVTPMNQEGNVDFQTLNKLIERHIAAGTSGLIILGTTGEAATITAEEKKAVIRHVVAQVNERLPVIAGTHANGTKQVIDLTWMAMEEGVDACLIMTPAYIKPTQEGLYQHYKAIADAVAIPQILYNVPSRTVCDLLPETLARLSNTSNIIGIKEATGEVERTREIKALCEDKIDIYSGEDASALDLMFAGAKGVISVTANVAPEMMQALCKAALAGEKAQAKEINDKLMPLHQALFLESNPIPCKWMLNKMGLIPGGIRLPLTPLAEEYTDQAYAALQTAGLV